MNAYEVRMPLPSTARPGLLSPSGAFIRPILMPARGYPKSNLRITGACTDWTG